MKPYKKNISHYTASNYFEAMQASNTYHKRLITWVTLTLLISLESCSLVFPIIAPFTDLPEPTGPYTVATQTTCWTDSSRDETFTEVSDFRRIMVQAWYPMEGEAQGQPQLYIDDPEIRLPALAQQLRLPVSLFRHFDQVRSHSYIAGADNPLSEIFPVILFSHGLSGMRFQNTALLEELASHGYVVLAADHSYGANVTIFPNGDIAQYQVGKRRITRSSQMKDIDLNQLKILVEDLQFMADQLQRSKANPFLKKMPYDASQIGAVGHSIGGAAILNTLAIDERFQAAMVLDGWYIPIPDSINTQGVNQPVFHLGQKEWVDQVNYELMDLLFSNSSGPILKMLIPETLHTDFTDMPLFTPFSSFIGYTKTRDPLWINDLIRAQTLGFFNTYLKGNDPTIFIEKIEAEQSATSYIFIPPKP